TPPPRFPDPEGRSFKVMWCAEMCTATQSPILSWQKSARFAYSERCTRPRT
ncbi:hypothetical protein BJV77DRAFT_1052239, partial [Russula vinacea]